MTVTLAIDAPAATPLPARAGAAARRLARGNVPAYLAAWLVAAIAANSWFVAGTFVATGDMGPFIRRGWDPWWSWGHAISGAGSATYAVARLYEFALIEAVSAAGGYETFAQRLFYVSIYGMVAVGVAAFAAVYTGNRIAIAAAGAFGVLNGFFLTRLPNPLNIISVGTCAVIGALLLRVAKGRGLPAPLLAVAFLPAGFLSYNPPMLTVAIAWTALGVPTVALLTMGWRAAWFVVRYGIAAGPWVLLLNAFWLVPFAMAFTGGGGAAATAATDPTAWAWSQAQNTVPNVLTLAANWAWYKPQYLPFTPMLDQPWWIWTRYLLPALAFAAPVLARPRRRRAAVALLLMVAVGVVLAKGLQPPLPGLNLFLYKHVPGFWLFREPMSKLGQLLVLFLGALLAIAVEGMAARLPRVATPLARIGLRGAAVASVTLVLLWPHPLLTGEVIPDVRPKQPPAHVAVPSEWRRTAEALDQESGKVLILPLDDYYQMPTTWGFAGVDSIATLLVRKAVVQRKPDGYFGDPPGFAAQVDATERALLAGDLDAVVPLLRSLGVGAIVLRHDLLLGDPTRTFADPQVLGAALDRTPGIVPVQRGLLDIYRVPTGPDGSSTSEVTTYDGLLEAPPEPQALAATVASLDGTRLVVPSSAAPTVPEVGAATRAAAPAEALTAAGAVTWQVPAVDGPEAQTTFTTTGGRFRLAQRARGSAVLTPEEDRTHDGPALRLVDRAQVRVDGEVVQQRPEARYPLARPGVVAVTAGNRTVSLDGWRNATLPDTSSASAADPTVAVGAATPLTAWALREPPASLGAFGPVYDCNNYEPRPWAELGLRAEGDGEVLRLSALDHAACVAAEVAGVTAGDTVRVRLEHRFVEGKRPQVCLLEVLAGGADRCVPGARLRMEDGWLRYEAVHTVAADAVALRVVLYANVGLRLQPRTTSEYRRVQVEALEPVLDTVAWPEPVPAATVDLAPGEHTLSVTGGQWGSVLAEFEDVDDCFRYDDRTEEEAGITASVLDEEGGPAFELRAIDHMACLGATIPDFGGSELYELRFEHRSVALRKPRVCLYLKGPDVCEPMTQPSQDAAWTEFRRDVRARIPVLEARLYLYGLRDLAGREQSIVQYRQVAVRAPAVPATLVLTRAPEPATVIPAEWRQTTPASFRAVVTPQDGRVLLAVSETGAPGWALGGVPEGATVRKVLGNGWSAAWVVEGVEGPLDARMVYAPALTVRTALKVSGLVALLAAAWLLARRPVRRRVGRWWR